jgi:protocatechuate 4,5-dioxygenase, alpha chain
VTDPQQTPTVGSNDGFDDVPGTYFFDGRRSRQGYALNMFCMSLLKETNRERFRADEDVYLDDFKLTSDQREAVRKREWIRMLDLGGNIYYTFKLAACDGMTFQQLAALQTGVTEQQYLDMMIAGGRSVEGNRSRSEQLQKTQSEESQHHG